MKRTDTALRRLFACYLHQDWNAEFATPQEAVAAFLAGSRRPTRAAARAELARLLQKADDEPALLAKLQEFGCCYWPAGDGLTARDWLNQVAEQLAPK